MSVQCDRNRRVKNNPNVFNLENYRIELASNKMGMSMGEASCFALLWVGVFMAGMGWDQSSVLHVTFERSIKYPCRNAK